MKQTNLSEIPRKEKRIAHHLNTLDRKWESFQTSEKESTPHFLRLPNDRKICTSPNQLAMKSGHSRKKGQRSPWAQQKIWALVTLGYSRNLGTYFTLGHNQGYSMSFWRNWIGVIFFWLNLCSEIQVLNRWFHKVYLGHVSTFLLWSLSISIRCRV